MLLWTNQSPLLQVPISWAIIHDTCQPFSSWSHHYTRWWWWLWPTPLTLSLYANPSVCRTALLRATAQERESHLVNVFCVSFHPLNVAITTLFFLLSINTKQLISHQRFSTLFYYCYLYIIVCIVVACCAACIATYTVVMTMLIEIVLITVLVQLQSTINIEIIVFLTQLQPLHCCYAWW